MAATLLAWQGSKALAAFFAHNWWAPVSLDVNPNWRVLAFTVAVSLGVGIISGLVPALRGTRMDLTPALKTAAGSGAVTGYPATRPFLRHCLVVWQVAMAALVLVGSGLFLRTIMKLEKVDLGFNPRNLLLFSISPEQSGYKDEAVKRLYGQVLGRVSALPGVASATYSNQALISASLSTHDFWVRSKPHPISLGTIGALKVGPNFFDTMRIPILQGRGITPQDIESAQNAAVINVSAARRFFPSENPLGQEFSAGDDFKYSYQIVGICADAKYDQVSNEIIPTSYSPLRAWNAWFALRTAADPRGLMPSVRRAMREIDPTVPILEMLTQTEQIDKTLFEQRLLANLSIMFGGLALVLACVGLHGVVSYSVAQRTNEIGIRLAMGAGQRDILRLILRQGVALTITGLAIGLGTAVFFTRLVKAFLYGVQPLDALTFVGGSLVLLAVQLVASYLPARRATKVDPMVALRYE